MGKMGGHARLRLPRSMSLRFRLVAALGALLVLGLAAFGVGTYVRYAGSEYERLDQRLQSLAPVVTRQLDTGGGGAGGAGEDGEGGRGPERGGGPVVAPTGTYAELRDAQGAVTSTLPTAEGQSPELPDAVERGRPFTVGSATGTGRWRVYAADAPGPDRGLVLVAIPTGDVERSLRGLVLIETIAGLALLGLVTAGSWLILRRGLRPLEDMAVTARSINAGDLSHRVASTDARSEVGQLGLALNSMLDEIEVSFRERDATERKLRQFLRANQVFPMAFSLLLFSID